MNGSNFAEMGLKPEGDNVAFGKTHCAALTQPGGAQAKDIGDGLGGVTTEEDPHSAMRILLLENDRIADFAGEGLRFPRLRDRALSRHGNAETGADLVDVFLAQQPMLPLGLVGLWGARHGVFPARRERA